MTRVLKLSYGLLAYMIFLVTILYAVGFTCGGIVPKAIDDGKIAGDIEAIGINLFLLAVFAIQHSVMARPAFKRWWMSIIPHAVERSTYVLLASLSLALLFWQWRPMPAPIWSLSGASATAVVSLFWAGWGLAVLSTFLISHFDLFGIRQVLAEWTGTAVSSMEFKTPFLYKLVRHPIYLGFIIAFWAAPVMSNGHLLFSAGMTIYILIGIHLEERDLVDYFGADYSSYCQRVGMLIPSLRFWRSESHPESKRSLEGSTRPPTDR